MQYKTSTFHFHKVALRSIPINGLRLRGCPVFMFVSRGFLFEVQLALISHATRAFLPLEAYK